MNRVLNYPGSKWKIAKQLINNIPEHKSYLEPYFGSGAVLFNKAPSPIETINDLDHNIITLFQCIKQDPEHLAAMIAATPFAREIYSEQFDKKIKDDPYEQALSFLIKCWQGHSFRPAGGKTGWRSDISGRERAYSLSNWYQLPEWVIQCAERLRLVQIENQPALNLIKRYNTPECFMYIDPPYLLNTRSGKQYLHEMDEKDHIELLETIVKSKAEIMISGYESELYDCYLRKWNRMVLKSNAADGGIREEIVWMNYNHQMSLFEYLEEN